MMQSPLNCLVLTLAIPQIQFALTSLGLSYTLLLTRINPLTSILTTVKL